MKKVLGITGLLLVVCIATAIANPRFINAYNLQNTVRWTALFAIISIGVAFVIMSGGIDLSVGSVIGLVGTMLAWLLTIKGVSTGVALLAVLLVCVFIGLAHGLLITKLRLQPFVVTLCGLLLYRGLARWLSDDQTLGFGTAYERLRYIAIGQPFAIRVPGLDRPFMVPMPFLIMLVLALAAGVLLNHTVFGRYLLAVGRNEQAARYSGVNTQLVTISAYVLCAVLAGLGGVLFSLDVNSIQPSGLGEFFELYAIAAAVLGGCSLRGGEGTILGVIIGAAVMRVLYNAINILGIPTQLEFAIIGVVILGGVITDELVKRFVIHRRVSREIDQAISK
jgi:ribose transport system permease protein